jgi:hypothetical protein
MKKVVAPDLQILHHALNKPIRYKNWQSVAPMLHAFEARRHAPISSFDLTRLDFVHIAPHPGFAGLNGTNQWMLRLVEMFGGVLVFRRVATTHMSTDQTQAQVNPGIAKLYAFSAYMRGRRSDFDLIEVRAFCRHRFPISQ